MEGGIIRNGRIEDASAAGKLIREAGDRFMDVLTAARNRGEAEAVLSSLWVKKANRFSMEQGRVYELEGQAAGIALGYLQSEMSRLDAGTFRDLLMIRGPRLILAGLLKPRLVWELLSSREAEAGDWYLCILAADPRYRGRGIGTALLEDSEGIARSSGARALSLMVGVANEGALQLYRRFGFRVRDETRIGEYSLSRMVKDL